MSVKVWCKGVLVSAAIFMAGILLVSFMLYRFRWSDTVLAIPAAAIYGMASLGGGFMVGRKASSHRFLWGLVYGAAFFVLMLFVSLMAGGSVGGEGGELLKYALISIGGGMIGGMMS